MIIPVEKEMQINDFLKIFGNWIVEMKLSDGQMKEFEVRELYEMFNLGVILDSKDIPIPYWKKHETCEKDQ